MAQKQKKGDHRAAKLWDDLQKGPARESVIPALVATIEDLPTPPKWDDVLADLRRSNPAKRVGFATDLFWAIKFFKGQAWLKGEQLCVQPVGLANYYAPLIRALKTELILLLKERCES